MDTIAPPCRHCIELNQFLDSARQPETPALLVGLSEAGLRNRAHQRKERLLKAEADLRKHMKAMHGAGIEPVSELSPDNDPAAEPVIAE